MPSTTNNELLSDFENNPLYCALVTAHNVTPQVTVSREQRASTPTNVHTLFASTLFTPIGLRAMQSFLLHAPPKPVSIDEDSRTSIAHHRTVEAFLGQHHLDEWLVLASLGTGLNGPGGIVHGGLLMTLLDSAMAVRALRGSGATSVVTTQYKAEFKRKVQAPCVVLCRARLDERAKDS